MGTDKNTRLLKKLRRSLPLLALALLCSHTLFAQTTRPLVYNIKAVPQERGITVSWELPSSFAKSNVQSLVVLRSTKAFETGTSIQKEIPVATLTKDSTLFTDILSSTIPYYYCVVAKLENGSFYDMVIPTANATVYPAAVIRKDAGAISEREIFEERELNANTETPHLADNQLRSTPLPYLHIFPDDSEETETIPASVIANAARLGQEDGKAPVKTAPFVFEKDAKDNSTGDDYTLYSILATSFTKGDYVTAEKDLRSFLQTKHSLDVTCRSTIYLGQSLFFQGRFRDALNCFLTTESVYPAISKRWIQTTLDAYSKE